MSPRSGASSALFKHANKKNTNEHIIVNDYSQGNGPHSAQGHASPSPKRSPTCLSLSASGLSPRAKRVRTADSRGAAPPSVVKEQDGDEPDRALWAVAFPSLPRLPAPVSAAVSAASLLDSLPAAVTVTPSFSYGHPPSSPGRPAPARGAEAKSPSYGWFVFTDADGGDGSGAPARSRSAAQGTFLLGTPDLPSRIPEVDAAMPGAGHHKDQGKTFLPVPTMAPPGAPLAFEGASDQDVAVQQALAEQQALAADTVDDVLGDLF